MWPFVSVSVSILRPNVSVRSQSHDLASTSILVSVLGSFSKFDFVRHHSRSRSSLALPVLPSVSPILRSICPHWMEHETAASSSSAAAAAIVELTSSWYRDAARSRRRVAAGTGRNRREEDCDIPAFRLISDRTAPHTSRFKSSVFSILQVSLAADGPARRAVSRHSRCIHRCRRSVW